MSDELVRHQSPVLAGKAGRAQKGRGSNIATAAGKVENPIGIARVVPLRCAVCGVGLSGDQDHRSSFSLFRALDLNLPRVARQASSGVARKRSRLRRADEGLRQPIEELKRIAHRPNSNNSADAPTMKTLAARSASPANMTVLRPTPVPKTMAVTTRSPV